MKLEKIIKDCQQRSPSCRTEVSQKIRLNGRESKQFTWFNSGGACQLQATPDFPETLFWKTVQIHLCSLTN